MMLRSSRWLLSGIFAAAPLFGLFAQVTSSVYDSDHTYREVTSTTDGCPTDDHLCHYHPGMNAWGNSFPIKEYNYRGFNGGTVVEFMNWRMVFPVGFNINNPVKYPLILMLHGSGESGRIGTCCFGTYASSDIRYDNNDHHLLHGGMEHQVATGYNVSGVPSGPVKFPGIVVWPQSSFNAAWESGWNNGLLAPDARMAVKILEYIISNYNVDPDRVSIHGLSAGAVGTWDLAAKRPDLFAAMLPMSGVASNYDVQSDILVTTPIWLFQGGLDTNPNPQASQILTDMIIAKGGNITRTLYPNTAHGTWYAAYAEPNFFPFMLAANKKNIYVFGGEPSICSGGTLKLGFSAGFTAYQWTLNGSNIPGATSRFYNATLAGDYAVKYTRVTDGSIATSFTLHVTVKAGSTFTPVQTNTGSVNLTVNLSGITNVITFTAPLGYSSYKWMKDHSLVQTTSTNTRSFSNGSGSAGDAGVYTVAVLEGTGCTSQESNPITVVWNASQPGSPKPNTPTFVKLSPTQIRVNWNSMPSEAGFEVWRQQFSTSTPPYGFKGYVLAAALPAGTTSYIDQVRPGGSYRYLVRAIHSAGTATFSNDASNSVTSDPDVTPPTAPTNLVVSNATETQVTLTWNPASDNDRVYKYEVYNGSTLVTTLTGGAEALTLPLTTTAVTGLSPYVSYSLSVRAIDYTGNYSPFSDPVAAATAVVTNGLNFKYYTFAGTMPGAAGAQLAEPGGFNFAQTPAQFGTIATFSIAGASGYQGNIGDPDRFVYSFDGFIDIPVAGKYRFWLWSDDGSRLYLDGALLINNDGAHGALELTHGPDLTLTAGKKPIRVTYFEQAGGNSLIVSWAKVNNPTFAKIPIQAEVLYLPSPTITNYYLVNTATPDLSQLSSWTTSPTGGIGTGPANFTTPFQYFNVANQTSVTLATPWTVTGNGSKVVVGDGGLTTTTLTLNAPLTALLEARKNGVINVVDPGLPAFGVLDPASTVNFNVAGNIAIPNASYGNVNFITNNTYTLPLSTTTIQGNLAVAAGAALTGTATNFSALRIGGDLSFDNIGNPFPTIPGQKYSLVFTGGKTHTVSFTTPVDPSLFALQADFGDNIVFNNSGTHTYTFGSSQGGGLTLKNGSTLNVGANNLVVNGLGAVNPNSEIGVIAMSGGDFTLTTTGTQNSAVYFSASANQVNNFIASAPANTIISLQSRANIRNQVTVSGGELNSNSGSLTLLSDATGTARIAPITGGARITGSITAQRYMDGGLGRIYRYISSPVKGLTAAALQQNIPITGVFTGASTGLGLSSAASMFSYRETDVPPYANFPANNGTNLDTLTIGRGYAIFVREGTNPTTWQAKGTPYQGTIPFTLTAGTPANPNDGWNLLGNPYASAIQWTGASGGGWTLANINPTVYVRHNFGSQFQWFVYRPGIQPTDLLPGQAILAGGLIAPGQAFWVMANTAPSLSISEAAKAATNTATYYRTGSPAREEYAPDVLDIRLSNATYGDVAYIMHDDQGTENYEKLQDAVKQPNSFFNLSTRSKDGISLAINVTPNTFCEKEIKLNIENAAAGNYTLGFYGLETFKRPVTATLQDNFTGTTTQLQAGSTYNFAVTTDAASSGAGRFVLTEKPLVLTNAAMKTNSVCESDPSVTLVTTQPGVHYQALYNGGVVSELITSTGTDSLRLTLDRKALGYGTHAVSLMAGFPGCDVSAMDQTINISVDTLQTPSIQYQNGFLVASPANADHYQWMLDGSPLTGKTDQSLMDTNADGSYQVTVSVGACSKVSSTYNVTGIDTDLNSLAKLYPNPFHDQIVVTLPEKIQGGTASLTNPIGQTVQSQSIAPQDSNSVTLNFAGVEPGAYVLSLGRYKFKVIKVN